MKKPVPILTRVDILFVILPVIFLIVLITFGSRQMEFSRIHFAVSPTIAINDSIAGKLYKMKPRSVFTLCEMLHDENWEIREQAAWALGRTKDYRAVEPLIMALKDKDPGVRWIAAWALGEIGNKKAFEPLLSACTDPDNETTPDIDTWIMRERILKEKASARRSGITYEGSIFSGVDIQREAVRSLLKIDRKEAEKRLIPLIEKEKRAGVLAAMEMKDCSYLTDLINLLEIIGFAYESESWNLIQDVETALKRMACPDLVNAFLFGKLYGYEESVLRRTVKGMDPDIVLASALPALRNKNLNFRKRALDLANSFWDDRVKTEVVRLLNDKDPAIREEALDIVRQHDEFLAKKILAKKLKDRDQDERINAAETLLRMGDLRGVGLLISATNSNSSCYNAECLVQWLGEIGNEQARQTLLSFIKNWSPMDAPACLRAYHATLKLGELKEKRAIPFLSTILRKGNDKEKEAARIALGKLGDTRFIPTILKELENAANSKSNANYKQRDALIKLKEIAHPSAATFLAKFFRSGPHWQDWGWASDVLNTVEKCFGKPLIPLLQEQLNNPVHSIRIRAAEILAQSHDTAASAALRTGLTNDDPHIRKIALDSLGAANLIAKQQLIQLFQEEQNWRIKFSALAILKKHPISPADLQALAQTKNKSYLIRHQLKRMDKEFASTKEDDPKSRFMPIFPSIMILNEKGIHQADYSSMDNEYKISRSGELAGYSQALRTKNFLFVSNNYLITRLDHEFHPDKSIELERIGALVSNQNLLYVSADGHLIILDENLNVQSRFPLGIFEDYSGKKKNAHDIAVGGNIAYLLDNISHPIFTLKIDVTDPKRPEFVQETEIEFINHHLDTQWIASMQNEWRIVQSSSHMGGSFQWLLKFSLISGKLKDRLLLFRNLENASDWSRIDGWIEAIDPLSPEWMVIRKDDEYFLGRLSMETGELVKQGLFPLGMSGDSRSRNERRWRIRGNGKLFFVFNDFYLWVIRIDSNPEILVYQEFHEKILDMVISNSFFN